MTQLPLVPTELIDKYTEHETRLIEWMHAAIKDLPTPYVYVMVSFRANDFLKVIQVPYEQAQDAHDDTTNRPL